MTDLNEAALADSELVDRLHSPISMSMFASKDDMIRALLADRSAAAAGIAALSAEMDRLTKRLDEAAKVIEPFAAFDETGILYADGAPVVVKSEGILDLTMTLGHFRAARSWQASRGEGQADE